MPTLPSVTTRRVVQAASLLLAVNLVFTACGGSSTADSDEATTSEPTTAVEEETGGPQDEQPPADPATDEPADSDEADEPSDSDDQATGNDDSDEEEPPQEDGADEGEDDDGVPGEPLDFGPQPNTPLSVVGVDYDDVLNFRAEPDPTAEILAIAVPTAEIEILALGEAWSAPTGVWWKVTIDGQEAWANQKFLGGAGAPSDLFAQVSAELATLEFESLEDAAEAVAATRASTDPASRVVFATEPLAFDAIGGFVIVDVLDLGDDSVKGERLRIEVDFVFDEDGEEGAQAVTGVVLTAVEITPICGRGVSDGLCV